MARHEFETLLYSVEDAIATITLNRPDRMNAFTPRMMLDMIEAFDLTDPFKPRKIEPPKNAGAGGIRLAPPGGTGAGIRRPDSIRGCGRISMSAMRFPALHDPPGRTPRG